MVFLAGERLFQPGRAKNHGSVRGHEEELMQKAWKACLRRRSPGPRTSPSRSGPAGSVNARHPGIPRRCAKRDVPRAFKRHFLQFKDVQNSGSLLNHCHHQPGDAVRMGWRPKKICGLERGR